MLGLLYYGRLEKEKGFNSILETIQNFQQKKKSDCEIFIFGIGSLEKDLLPLTNYSNVHYFGWQSLSKIKQYLSNIDYCLMPSEFLETFGLSALNALSRGIPVIGYKKGGLEPFILSECNLFAYKGKNTAERLEKCIEKLSDNTTSRNIEKINQIVQKYTKDARYQRFLELNKGNNPQKIVLVSDFINPVGGIETYLYDVKTLLESKGHEVILRGGYLPKGILGKIRIYLGLFFAPINFWSAIRFKRFLKKEKPDLIWYNSLLRNLGGNIIFSSHPNERKIRMMYHDFGYFYPFPAKLFFIDQIKTPLNFQNFMSAENLIHKLATVFKYLRMKGLIKSLKEKADLHLVPSAFMEPIVSESYGLKIGKVKSFPHFVQE
ncbi:hypothetical protein AGMMS50249_8150 [candidate division SR1 bacterium]|nr:hypothetical protein AGMMS50249_8150 [candidate division SR1 bacterium]